MTTPAGFELTIPDRNELVIKVPGPQGPRGSNNVYIQADEPLDPGPWMWVQTNLGVDGSGFTIWIEDGE